ncbi:zinc finger mym-type protein 2-like [Gigaspora margarita]|uniref:Zinc finger mym-type protein 2-like n=1 Tax=Gigaspora margarita TaxID=4874 RepID=A0A8H4ANT6_GIGMA|nr:zinc finger mym-type protein 2-like [Gigaspora margarita]
MHVGFYFLEFNLISKCPKLKKKEKTYQKPTEEQLSYLRNKSKVQNTHRSTQNWINKFQEYRSDVGLEGAPEDIDDTSKLETQLCEYFTVAKKSDGSEYTVSSLLSAVRAINRFYNSNFSKVKPVDLCDKKAFPSLWEILDGKTRDLSEKGYDYSSIKVWYKKTQLGQLKLKSFMKVLAEKTDIGANDYEVSTITRHRSLSGIASYERPKDGVQKSALSNLMNAIDSNVDKMISQNQPSTTLPTKDFYQGFKSARQIYQEASVEASIITPQPANLHEFQSSKIPLQERPSVANQNHEMQELLQRNLFMNFNITLHVHNHYYASQQ